VRYSAPVLDRVREVVCALSVGLALACGGGEPSDRAAAEEAATETRPASTAPADESAERSAPPQRSERPLPAFSGWTLAGERLEISSLIGKRLVVWFFNPEVDGADAVAEATARVARLRGGHNFQIVGVAVGSDPEAAKAFVGTHDLDIPVIDDSSARITRRFGLRSPLAMLGVDADGYLVWGFGQFPTSAPDAVDRIEGQLRGALRLPEEESAPPGARPAAPAFSAPVLDREEPFSLADHRGEPVVLIFFLHTCPHCHEALEFLKSELAGMPEETRPVLVGVEVTGRTAAVRSTLERDDLDFFPVVFDDDGRVQADYGVFGGVPDLVLIDREGRIAGRTQGWRGEEDARLMRMRIAKLAGAPVPMLLRQNGYSGNEVCGVCHESQHQTWQLTQHATAYDTLVRHAEETNPECVGCHVVGFEEPGGFLLSGPDPALENVGCESCHGRGGPHLSPGFVTAGDYREVCVTCHDKKHSLGFEYASFLPEVSHAANAHILELPAEERRAILAERGAMRTDLLPTGAAYVGSEACQSCHPSEFATWAGNPHAAALASLEREGKAGDADCLRCHTTGFGREGGFPPNAQPAAHPDLARVGCESCHGPGGNHVTESAPKLGSIVSLGDKCDSCVILQICGSCHDDANDPGFEFEVQEKIDRIRHGTIEAGTGRPLDDGEDSASIPGRAPGLSESALLARAFETHDAREATEREGRWTRP